MVRPVDLLARNPRPAADGWRQRIATGPETSLRIRREDARAGLRLALAKAVAPLRQALERGRARAGRGRRPVPPMQRVTALLLVAAAMGPVVTRADLPARQGAYYGAKATEYPDWFKQSFLDLPADIAEAREQGRRVLVFFSQDNCPYCNLLVERNLAQRSIEETLRRHFDVVLVNLWGDREVIGVDGKAHTEKTLGAALRVQFTPTLLFFDEDGHTVLRLNGYVPPGRLQAALDWVSGRQEKTVSFRDYVAAREGADQGRGELTAAGSCLAGVTDLRRRADRPRALAVLFEQRDCPDCEVLHRRVLSDPEVREALGRMDCVQLDMWSRTEVTTPGGEPTTARDWAQTLDIKYAPGIVLFDARGEEVIRWESSFRVFHTAGMLDYVLSGEYEREPSFQRFLSARAERLRAGGRDVNIWRYADEPLDHRP